jgi:hypothetical protein
VPDIATLAAEVAAWATQRNAADGSVDWRFTTEDARIKLKRLYPSVQRAFENAGMMGRLRRPLIR